MAFVLLLPWAASASLHLAKKYLYVTLLKVIITITVLMATQETELLKAPLA